jgi:serine/threonine protein kinase
VEPDIERPKQVETILAQALATPPADRSAFLDTACGGDSELRRSVESLISDHDQSNPSQESSRRGRAASRSREPRIPPRLKQALKQKYLIQECIGGGGMGDLYLATHRTLGGKWAVKVLASDLAKDPKVVERFINEAKIEANLQHPNIVKVFNIGQSGGYHYFVMNYVDGEDLAGRIARCGVIAVPEAVSIAYQICKALECAHEHNIVHRDLKPSNVRIDRYGTVIVIDFGIARVRAVSGVTMQGQRLGTPLYMSPEQIQGLSPDFRSDLYSLGVLLYEMLTGTNPFRAESPIAVFAKHLNFQPPLPSEANPRINKAVSDVVMRLLEKDPAKRFQSAREVSGALRPWRDVTEITPSAETVTPPTALLAADDQLIQLVVPVRGRKISRPLSADERKLMELADGSRTVGEILPLSQLDADAFFSALESLKGEGAVRTVSSVEQAEAAQGLKEKAVGILEFLPSGRAWQLGAVAVVVLLLATAVTIYFKVRPQSGVPIGGFPVRLDASPYASVTVMDTAGKTVKAVSTPAQIDLPKGRYRLVFDFDGRKLEEEITVSGPGPVSFRKEYWKEREIESLLDRYLKGP